MPAPTTLSPRLMEAPELSEIVAGLVYMNQETGECTADREEVLGWVLGGVSVVVHGYYTYEWDGNDLVEVWH